MSDDLVERLRSFKPFRFTGGEWFGPAVCAEAADTIEALRAENKKLNAEVERWIESQGVAFDQAMANGSAATLLRAKLSDAVGALERIAKGTYDGIEVTHLSAQHCRGMARAALSTIKGE